jgi:hypothetical protein
MPFPSREPNADPSSQTACLTVNPLTELEALFDLFPEAQPLVSRAEHIPSSQTPEPYKKMLVHEHHMTVTMESYHGTSVDVRVLDQKLVEDMYCRKILLLKSGTDEVVQFGIVRFNLQYVTIEVRDQILGGAIPLGRVLINHNVLRHIDLGAVVKLTAGPGLASHLQMNEGSTTYGRLATIFCNHRPAVDLLEVSAPL